jgi:tRNA(fMet)-specific endonuclease VapC
MGEKMILFDSDAFIELMRQNAEVVDFVRSVDLSSIYINPIIKAEIQFKAINKRDLALVNSRIDAYPVIPLDDGISEKFSDLFEKYILSHRPGVADMLVASTAVSYDIPLFTLNTAHFNFIRELKLVKHTIKPLARTKGSWFQ